ncbi:MAG: hypothetical protein R3A47_08595 [Polyangiales bacterium]
MYNKNTRRYAGWRDREGKQHDAGYTYVNLEALARGLGSERKAHDIFAWLSSPVAPTKGGGHKGSTDVYQLVASPRTTTQEIPINDWDGWSDPGGAVNGTRHAYGNNVQNGGAVMFISYYDVMARLRWVSADNAFGVLRRMLTRTASDSNFLRFDSKTRKYNDFGENFGEFGTNLPFPETGIAAMPMLYGFIGAKPSVQGLEVKPDLPMDLLDATTKLVGYGSGTHQIAVQRAEVLNSPVSANTVTDLSLNATVVQPFSSEQRFNEIQVYVGTYGTSYAAFVMRVQKQVGDKWKTVNGTILEQVPDNDWRSISFPEQNPGNYRILLSDPFARVAWWRDSSVSDSGARIGKTAVKGRFVYRIVRGAQSPILTQTEGTSADRLDGSLGQTFIANESFDEVRIRVGTYKSTSSGFSAVLYRDIGGKWSARARTHFRRVEDNEWVTMAFSHLPKGKYLLQIFDPVGSIAWYRSSSDELKGTDQRAYRNITPVSGDRTLEVRRGTIRIASTIGNVDVTVPAGSKILLK